MGYIYILTNPSFLAYVKIGFAEDVDQRLSGPEKTSFLTGELLNICK